MTTSDSDIKIHCKEHLCYGVVKKYDEDGPRSPPDEAIKSELSLIDRLKRYVGINSEPIEWYECSVCGKHHSEIEE